MISDFSPTAFPPLTPLQPHFLFPRHTPTSGPLHLLFLPPNSHSRSPLAHSLTSFGTYSNIPHQQGSLWLTKEQHPTPPHYFLSPFPCLIFWHDIFYHWTHNIFVYHLLLSSRMRMQTPGSKGFFLFLFTVACPATSRVLAESRCLIRTMEWMNAWVNKCPPLYCIFPFSLQTCPSLYF